MLVLTRKQGETIRINGNITLAVVNVGQGRVRISIDAPKDVVILRGELCDDQSTDVLSDLPSGLVATH